MDAFSEEASFEVRRLDSGAAERRGQPYLDVPANRFIKTLVFLADGEPVVAMLRGDQTLSKRSSSRRSARRRSLADAATVIGVAPGFLGPIGLKLRVLADLSVHGMRAAVTGANEPNAHFINVDQERDFTPTVFADLRLAIAGDPCPRCEHGRLEAHRGIEVGQVFYLGTKYSVAMGATYLDAEGRERPIEMGCYGIGVSRLVAAAIEQNHDANGIIWPFSVAPFQVLLLPINYKDQSIREATDNLYGELQKHGVEVLLDDRDERPGVKFKDADLVGIPLRVTIGAKGLEKGCLELRSRREGKTEEVPVADGATKIRAIVNKALQA
jgi:prolyl-tRNA synthetase